MTARGKPVQRSFIRVEADEVTYDLHIILRFRRRKSPGRSGDFAVAEVPGVLEFNVPGTFRSESQDRTGRAACRTSTGASG